MPLDMDQMQRALLILFIAFILLELNTSRGFSKAQTIHPISIFDLHKLGRMVYARDKKMSAGDAAAILQVQNPCECRTACRSFVGCVAISHFPNGDSLECRLAQKGPLESTFTDDEASIYMYKISTLGGYRVWYGEYNYYIPDSQLDYQSAKDFCLSVPHFRLAVMTTEYQNSVMKSISIHKGKKFYVDLQKTDDTASKGSPVWGDQTPFGGNNIAWNISITATSNFNKTAFMFEKRKLKETEPEKVFFPLCQAERVAATPDVN